MCLSAAQLTCVCFFRDVVATVVVLASAVAGAQEVALPKIVELGVFSSLGTSNDFSALAWGQKISAKLGITVIVANDGGAGDAVGAQFVASAVPNGATLVMNSVCFIATAAM